MTHRSPLAIDDHFASIGELDGVADEVDQDLRQTPTIAMTCWHFGSHLDLERELLVGGQRLKRATDGLGNILKGVIGKIENELASLDLRQIKHVIDQAEQVLAVALKPFEYAHRLFGQLAVDAVRHQFGVDREWR